MTTWIAVTRIIACAGYEYVINLDRVECIIPEYSKGRCRIAFADDAFDIMESYEEIYALAPKGLLPELNEQEND